MIVWFPKVIDTYLDSTGHGNGLQFAMGLDFVTDISNVNEISGLVFRESTSVDHSFLNSKDKVLEVGITQDLIDMNVWFEKLRKRC